MLKIPAIELLERLQDLGATVEVRDSRLRVEAPPGTINEDLKTAISLHRDKIIHVLTHPRPDPDDWNRINELAERLGRNAVLVGEPWEPCVGCGTETVWERPDTGERVCAACIDEGART